MQNIMHDKEDYYQKIIINQKRLNTVTEHLKQTKNCCPRVEIASNFKEAIPRKQKGLEKPELLND